jgi:hypothetical protein
VITCPTCGATNVDLATTHRLAGDLQWHGLCLDCGLGWDFDDDRP